MKFYREKTIDAYYWGKILFNKIEAIYNSCNIIWILKNGVLHNTKNASNYNGKNKSFYLNGKCYGDNFTKESWRRFIKMQVFI
jgi:hypothetical protein